jgi:RNA polymerase sigma-70 factor (sigma-E family)
MWTLVAAEKPAPARSSDRDREIERLYRQHGLELMRLARLLVDDRETAEDVAQDAFAGLYQRYDLLAEPAGALAYLRRSVVNGSRSVLRRRRTVRLHGRRPDDALTAEPADAGVLLADEHRRTLAAIGQLPDRQREVIVLRYWAQLPEAAIAATLGISVGAVKSSASRGRDALAALLESASFRPTPEGTS